MKSRFGIGLRPSASPLTLVLCYIVIVLCACVVKVASSGAKLAFFKDWVVVMAHQIPAHLTGKICDLITNIGKVLV